MWIQKHWESFLLPFFFLVILAQAREMYTVATAATLVAMVLALLQYWAYVYPVAVISEALEMPAVVYLLGTFVVVHKVYPEAATVSDPDFVSLLKVPLAAGVTGGTIALRTTKLAL